MWMHGWGGNKMELQPSLLELHAKKIEEEKKQAKPGLRELPVWDREKAMATRPPTTDKAKRKMINEASQLLDNFDNAGVQSKFI